MFTINRASLKDGIISCSVELTQIADLNKRDKKDFDKVQVTLSKFCRYLTNRIVCTNL